MGNCNRSNMGQRECGERYDMSSCQDFALAMAYVPWQHFEHVLCALAGLECCV